MSHKMFLWISLLDTFQMKNPSDATLASLSISKYSKWPTNGGKYCKNQHNTCIGSKKLTSLVVLTVFFWFIRPCPFKNCIMNCLKKSNFKISQLVHFAYKHFVCSQSSCPHCLNNGECWEPTPEGIPWQVNLPGRVLNK